MVNLVNFMLGIFYHMHTKVASQRSVGQECPVSGCASESESVQEQARPRCGCCYGSQGGLALPTATVLSKGKLSSASSWSQQMCDASGLTPGPTPRSGTLWLCDHCQIILLPDVCLRVFI